MIPAPWRESIGELRQDISHTIDQWLSKLKPQHEGSDLELDFGKNPLSDLSWDQFHIDVQEEEDALFVVAEIPGMSKEDLQVHLDGNWLTISGEKESQQEQKKGQMHYSECSYGAFSRTIPLPCGVNSDAVKAKYRHGVLKLKLPKSPSKEGRHIDVSYEA
ncbi:Hsp20/alpha crystallin family protein [Coraliomargarita sp. W4R72]